MTTAPFDFDGLQALVTGGGGYLGRAISRVLADAGAHVWVAGRTLARVENAAAELAGTRGGATPLLLDVTDPDAARRAAAQISDRTERLDILVSNAHEPRSASFSAVTSSDFAHAAGMAAGAAHDLVTALLPLLRRSRDAQPSSVILVASMYASVSPDPRMYDVEENQNPADYGAAKAGLVQYARHAAVHLASDGVRVNSISPGPFPQIDTADLAFIERLSHRVPLGRVGRAEELGTAALFLASPASSYVTGIDVAVDGGWTAW